MFFVYIFRIQNTPLNEPSQSVARLDIILKKLDTETRVHRAFCVVTFTLI